jgi:hypothetical protein
MYKKIQVNEGPPTFLIGYKATVDGKKLTVGQSRSLMRHYIRHHEVKCEKCKKGVEIARAIEKRRKLDDANKV